MPSSLKFVWAKLGPTVSRLTSSLSLDPSLSLEPSFPLEPSLPLAEAEEEKQKKTD